MAYLSVVSYNYQLHILGGALGLSPVLSMEKRERQRGTEGGGGGGDKDREGNKEKKGTISGGC